MSRNLIVKRDLFEGVGGWLMELNSYVFSSHLRNALSKGSPAPIMFLDVHTRVLNSFRRVRSRSLLCTEGLVYVWHMWSRLDICFYVDTYGVIKWFNQGRSSFVSNGYTHIIHVVTIQKPYFYSQFRSLANAKRRLGHLATGLAGRGRDVFWKYALGSWG